MSSLFTRALPLLFIISCILPSLWFGQDGVGQGYAGLNPRTGKPQPRLFVSEAQAGKGGSALPRSKCFVLHNGPRKTAIRGTIHDF